jgi:3-hydroxy-3-methylglutaryl CoA synthase
MDQVRLNRSTTQIAFARTAGVSGGPFSYVMFHSPSARSVQQAIKELLPKAGIVCVAPPPERAEVLCKPKIFPIKVSGGITRRM